MEATLYPLFTRVVCHLEFNQKLILDYNPVHEFKMRIYKNA